MAKKKSPNKRDLWLRAYLDESNSRSFMNKTEAAKVAGYKCSTENSFQQVGCQNFSLLNDTINQWLDDVGLSEARLKAKLSSLLEARETKFQTMKGDLDAGNAAPNISILSVATQDKYNNAGQAYTETDTLIGIEVENLELQRRVLDMALKVKGTYAPEKHDHSVKGEIKHSHEEALAKALRQKAAIDGQSGS
jgi:hypothetical protein